MAVQSLLVLSGLLFAGVGQAVLNDWRSAATVWARWDERFPPATRTPPALAGTWLLMLGSALVLLPMLPQS